MKNSPDECSHADGKVLNKIIINRIVEKLKEALKKHDLSIWMDLFYSEDDIAYEAQKIWFEKYIIELNPATYKFVIMNTSIDELNAVLMCRIEIEYKDFDPLYETHIYTIEYVEDHKDFCITWLEKIREQFLTSEKNSSHWINYINNIDHESHVDWWKNNVLIEAAYDVNDPDSPLIYARAIARNIRFREAHPMLECASILSGIMSLKLVQLAASIFNNNKLKYLANVYNTTKDTVLVKLIRDDRDNTWASKFLAPWYGFDEMLLFRDDKGLISGSCPSYMSLLAAMLRIGGYAANEVIQIRIGNQDALIVSINECNYLISSGKIEKLTIKSIYLLKKINKIFSDYYFWTEQGLTNIDKDKIEFYKKSIASRMPIFDFSWNLNNKYIETYDLDHITLPNLLSNEDPVSLNEDIRKTIIGLSKKYPNSVFTWAKYASQTLYVSKPETYLCWSIQSQNVRSKVANWNSLDEIIEEIKEFLNISIFLESDRIMTADQVLRHKRGDDKSIALLIFCWFKLKKNNKSYVLINKKSTYCAYKEGMEWTYLDVKSWEKRTPESNILLAFDDKTSIYPLLKSNDLSKFKSIYQVEEVFK